MQYIKLLFMIKVNQLEIVRYISTGTGNIDVEIAEVNSLLESYTTTHSQWRMFKNTNHFHKWDNKRSIIYGSLKLEEKYRKDLVAFNMLSAIDESIALALTKQDEEFCEIVMALMLWCWEKAEIRTAGANKTFAPILQRVKK